MKESVAIAKEVDAKKDFSPARSDKSVHRIRNEPERQFGSLRSVINNIRSDGGTPSVNSIATELSKMPAADQRASVLLALQRTHGNRYVQQVVAGIQAKLKVGQPGDVYEQEADRIAEEVMRMPEPEVKRQAEEEKEEEEKKEEEEILQAKKFPGQTPEGTPDLESFIQSMRSSGQSLSESVRDFFEPRFGYDLSQVRVHTDSRAAEAASAVNASAFTVGRDIVFGDGQYAPEMNSGKQLLAHELTHVLQQRYTRKQSNKFQVGKSLAGKRTLNASYRVMRQWTRQGVLGVLCSDLEAGVSTVDVLKDYSVYSYDSYTYKRQDYTDATKTTKKGPPVIHTINGYHNRKKKEIGITTKRLDAKAASTLVHEVVHAKQHMAYEEKLKKEPTATPPTKAEKEYEAHIKQEEFNIRKGISPKHSSFRKKEGGKWVVDEAAIRRWVDRVYAIGPKKYYTNYDYVKTGTKGPLRPWECPK